MVLGGRAGPGLIDYDAVSMGYRYLVDGGGDTAPLLPAELTLMISPVVGGGGRRRLFPEDARPGRSSWSRPSRPAAAP
jgi:hypothetical protein